MYQLLHYLQHVAFGIYNNIQATEMQQWMHTNFLCTLYTYNMHGMVHDKFTIVTWERPLCEVSKFNNIIVNNAD